MWTVLIYMLYIKVVACRGLETAERACATEERNAAVAIKERVIFLFLYLITVRLKLKLFFFCLDLWALQVS